MLHFATTTRLVGEPECGGALTRAQLLCCLQDSPPSISCEPEHAQLHLDQFRAAVVTHVCTSQLSGLVAAVAFAYLAAYLWADDTSRLCAAIVFWYCGTAAPFIIRGGLQQSHALQPEKAHLPSFTVACL